MAQLRILVAEVQVHKLGFWASDCVCYSVTPENRAWKETRARPIPVLSDLKTPTGISEAGCEYVMSGRPVR